MNSDEDKMYMYKFIRLVESSRWVDTFTISDVSNRKMPMTRPVYELYIYTLEVKL
jgi:hypothetical protein